MIDLITIENQNTFTVKGATKIRTSTPSSAVIEAGENCLIVTGSDMEVKKLDLDNKEVVLAGKFSVVKFLRGNEKQSFLKRIFK